MEFKLPDIGEGVHEGEITKWLVKKGDSISADDPMVEVMTDKATVEIPSPVTGVIESIAAEEGQTIEVGSVMVTITESGSKKSSESSDKGEASKQKAVSKEEESSDEKDSKQAREASKEKNKASNGAGAEQERGQEDEALPFNVLATPATRKLARDLSVDIKQVKGTGTKGRVTKADVQLAYEGTQAATQRTSHGATEKTSAGTAVARQAPLSVGESKRLPLKGVRKRIAQAMRHSKDTAAHFTYVEEVDMTEVVKLRKANKDEAANQGVKLTFLPFIMKALIPALKEFPFLNASLDDEAQEIILKSDYNLGIATDTEAGLMVPVIPQCDRKSIFELARDIEELTGRAKEGKSKVEDLKGGTFTITNAGSIGGVFATPVINHPEVAILGVNAIRKRPVVRDDQIVIADVMFLSLSVDHRVVDGADAARFMNRLVYFLTDPTRLVFA